MLNIPNDSTDPAFNLALEQYLVTAGADTELGQSDVFMLWQNEPVVVIGRNQEAANEVDLQYCSERGIKVVRRLSGGGAVYHDSGNLNFTVVARNSHKHVSNLELFARPVLEVLRGYGLDVHFSGRNDLELGGRKFSGNAQYNNGSSLLHHGTILWDSDLNVLTRALKPKVRTETRAVQSVESRVTNLAPNVPRVSLEQFRHDLCVRMGSSEVSMAGIVDVGKVERIANERYRIDAWNLRNSNPASHFRGFPC